MTRRLLLGLLILLVGGAGALLFWAYRPAAAVERAFTKLQAATTADFVTHLQLENNASTQQLLGEEGSVDIDLAGQWERQDGPDALATHITLTTQTKSLQITIAGELRLIEDKLYLLITTTPQAFPALVQLKDQWIVMDRGATAETAPVIADTSTLFTSVDRRGVEKIGDTSTVHYVAPASNEAVVSFMDSLAGILGTSLSEEQINQIRTSVTDIETIPLDLWIARWGSDLKQLKTALTVPGGNAVQFTLQFNALNQPVQIAAPTDARSLEEILQATTPQ